MMFMRFPIDAVFVGRPDPADGGSAASSSVRPAAAGVDRARCRSSAAPTGVLELPVGTIERTGTLVGDVIALGVGPPSR